LTRPPWQGHQQGKTATNNPAEKMQMVINLFT